MKRTSQQLPIPSSPPRQAQRASSLEDRIHRVGRDLYVSLQDVLEAIPGGPLRTQALAKLLGLDKVLTSRLLKALRASDPISVLHSLPGPAPLRRFLMAAKEQGADPDGILEAEIAVDAFEHLIRQDVGDRSTLNTMLSSWLPEARLEFETRRKQSAYKAMSELKGCSADLNLSTVFLNPSEDGEHVDVVWMIGHLGLRRLRPGASAQFVTRRMVADSAVRRPMTLQGDAIEELDRGRLDQFCNLPPAPLDVHRYENCVRYSLGGSEFGPKSAVDLLFAEVNLQELPRYSTTGQARRKFVFSEVSVPTRSLVFDALIHEDVYPSSDPQLTIYDTTLEGVANVNDPSRDMSRLDMIESVQSLGRGSSRLRISEAPKHVDVTRHIFNSMGWDETRFRAYRCRLEFPLHGSQVVLSFDPPARPGVLQPHVAESVH